jgi:hypothetical protein
MKRALILRESAMTILLTALRLCESRGMLSRSKATLREARKPAAARPAPAK